jgi:hypothetical protein
MVGKNKPLTISQSHELRLKEIIKAEKGKLTIEESAHICSLHRTPSS